jgi:hypothetical protein
VNFSGEGFFLSLACNTGDSCKMAFSFSGRYYALLLLELCYVHPGLAASHYRLSFGVRKQNGKFWSWGDFILGASINVDVF